MTDLSPKRLLAFARRIQPAASFTELVEEAQREVASALGYTHAWLMVAENERLEELRILDVSGERRTVLWELAPVIKVKDDAFLEQLVSSDVPIVIEDARVDPRTDKAMVERLQNRTLINVPLRMLDRPFGVFGIGTFGDEGCRAPSEAQVDYLIGMASQLAVAAGRIRFLEHQASAERERRELERRMTQMQRLESLGMLAGGIAHDFNNLLTVIFAGTSLAKQLAKTPEVSAELDAVQGAAARARDLTLQLLAMSRSQELRMQPVDLNARVAELVPLVRRIFPENITIDLIPAHNLPLIEADASQLDQVLMNLFINARDAMVHGGKLTIETEQVLVNGNYTATHPWARPGRYVLVMVTDTGVGMASDIVERVFEPFFSTKSPQAGTGLGLAVAHGIVSQHGGMLHCYSEPGVGASFKVYLPVLQRLAMQVGSKLRAIVPTGHERILLAEDDADVRAIAARILERAGYEVSAVETGERACQLAEQREFDLIMLDVVMPGMSCTEVIQRLRARRPNVPLLLASGYTAGANVVDILRDQSLALLRKPYDPDDLLRHVRAAIDGSQQNGQPSLDAQ